MARKELPHHLSEKASEGYQGWTNWETWNVALWFGNDEKLYKHVMSDGQRHGAFNATTAEELVRHLIPEGTPDFGGDAERQYAKVDWQEIADDFNEMAGVEEGEDEEDDEENDEDEDEEDDEEFDESDLEEAAVISDKRRGGYSASFGGKHLDDFDDFDQALLALYRHAVKSNYFPNFYYVNERGNTDLLEVIPKKTRGKIVGVTSKTIRSWV